MNELAKQIHEINLKTLLRLLQETSEKDRFGIIEDEDGHWLYKEVFDALESQKLYLVGLTDLEYRFGGSINTINHRQQQVIVDFFTGDIAYLYLVQALQATGPTKQWFIEDDNLGYQVFDNPKVWVVDNIDDLDNYRLLPEISSLTIQQQHIINDYMGR